MFLRLAVVLVLASAVIGVTEGGRLAEAAALAVPNACPQWDCKVITYWWSGGLKATGAFTPNTKGTVITNTAYADVFATTSDYKGKPKAVGNVATVLFVFIAAADDTSDILAKHTKALKAKDIKTRLKAVDDLASLGPKAAPATKDLCDLIATESNKTVIKGALSALEQVNPDLYRPVVKIVIDPLVTIKQDGIKEIGELGEKGLPASQILVVMFRAEVQKGITGVGGVNWETSDAAAKALAKLKVADKATVDMFKASASTSNKFDRTRSQAIDFLIEWAGDDKDRQKQLLPTLKAGINDPVWEVASRCITAAGKFGPTAKELLPILENLKLADNTTTRKFANDAVEKIRGKN